MASTLSPSARKIRYSQDEHLTLRVDVQTKMFGPLFDGGIPGMQKRGLAIYLKELLTQLGVNSDKQASLSDLTQLTTDLQSKETLKYKILSTAQDRTTDRLRKLFGDNIIQTSSQKALARMCQDAFVIGKKLVSQNQDTHTQRKATTI